MALRWGDDRLPWHRPTVVEVAETRVSLLATSLQVLIRAIRDRDLTRGHLQILAILAEHMSRATYTAWPGRERIGAAVEMTPRTVSKRLLEIRDHGYLEWDRQPDPDRPTRTLLHYRWRDAAITEAVMQIRARRDSKSAPRAGHSRPPSARQSAPQAGHSERPAGGKSAPPVGPESAPRAGQRILYRGDSESPLTPRRRRGEMRYVDHKGGEARAAGPRFDRSLPLAQRIDVGRYRQPATDDERQLLERMERAARGWDRDVLKAAFCRWMEEAGHDPPRDAQRAFVGWLERTAATRRRP